MKEENIALFKRFLTMEHINKIYKSYWDMFGVFKDSMTVEDWLRHVDSNEVISDAFRYERIGDGFAFKREFFEGLHNRWISCLSKAATNGWYTTYNNGFVRFLVKRDLDELSSDIIKKAAPTAQAYKKFIKAEEEKMKIKAEEKELEEKNPQPSPLAPAFEIISVENQHKLRGSQVSINNRKGSYRITFDIETSQKIIAAGLEYVQFARCVDDGRYIFWFSNSGGSKIVYSASRRGKKNVVVNSKALVSVICQHFGLNDNSYSVLDIHDMPSEQGLIFAIANK